MDGIKQRAYQAIWSTGLRGSETKEGHRYNVPGMNGFRRFCNKSMKDAISDDSPISSMIKKERMLGHSGLIKLDKNYFKVSSQELAKEYLSAVPNLTIRETENGRHVGGAEDANIGGAGTKSDPTPDHGTATMPSTGGIPITDDTVCSVCGRTNGAHSDEEYVQCTAEVAKKALPGQPDSGA